MKPKGGWICFIVAFIIIVSAGEGALYLLDGEASLAGKIVLWFGISAVFALKYPSEPIKKKGGGA